MDFTAGYGMFLGEEHELLRRTVRDFAEQEVAPHIRAWDRSGAEHGEGPETREHIRPILKRMGELGLLGICLPQKYGGAGMDYLALAIVCEELERVDSSLRVVMSVHTGLSSLSIFQWGSEEQKQRYLVPQAKGELLAGYGLTEPNSGTDAVAMESTARRDGDDYILNGEKIWISLADIADTFLVIAKTDPDKGSRGISAFIIERSMAGLSSYPLHGKLGVRAGNTGGLVMQDVRVPAANRLGEEGEGFKIAMAALDNGRYTVAAGATGLIQASLDASLKYAQERHTFGVPIADHQLVKRMISHMVRKLDTSRLLVYRAGWMKNQGLRNTRETTLAKWHATVSSFESADDAIQIHGAYGYSDEYPVERYLRNARGAIIYEGTRELQELLQADFALGKRINPPLRRELPAYDPEEWEA
ncbi:acyl-CoA dehydrogenase family protein [Oscillochloris sp. ZM17-4]|uniref:acyl-CoA dehydrogenase family protein n=1 Tax=Oscillochloris sp. ZM17-4 TaxID=2866714 RepID=UPI001C730F25|nr:acyl-CoA dehydrogenase family protein [Oscillochloris sp. ZM17-4]MBX0329478.1 acyl-CoA dehydrogenase family protein [Oscillochloris sp. ZM17-4]